MNEVPSALNDGAAAVDCWAGGVPDLEGEMGVTPVTETLRLGDTDTLTTGASVVRSGLVKITEGLSETSELGSGVSPGGMPMEPGTDVRPPWRR
jgi:hypothetical protein